MRKRNVLLNAVTITGLIASLFFLGSFMSAKTTNKPVVEEIKIYTRKNIRPKLIPYKAELEKCLSKSEKQELAELQKELRSAIEERKAAGLIPGEKVLLTTELSDEQIKTIKNTKAEFTNIVLRTMLIASNHEEDVQLILQEIQPEREKWQKDIETIISKNKPAGLFAINPILKNNLKKIQPFDSALILALVLWDANNPLFN